MSQNLTEVLKTYPGDYENKVEELYVSYCKNWEIYCREINRLFLVALQKSFKSKKVKITSTEDVEIRSTEHFNHDNSLYEDNKLIFTYSTPDHARSITLSFFSLNNNPVVGLDSEDDEETKDYFDDSQGIINKGVVEDFFSKEMMDEYVSWIINGKISEPLREQIIKDAKMFLDHLKNS